MLKVAKNRQFRSLPYKVVDLAIEEGWTKELSYLLHITSLTGNGIIYNYSSRSLSEKIGISKSAIHKNVRYLLEVGLLYLESGHLKSLNKSEMLEWVRNNTGSPTGNGRIKIKIQKSIKLTEWNLFARVPLNNISRQKFLSKKRSEVNAIGSKVKSGKRISIVEYKKYTKYRDTFEKNNTENDYSYSLNQFFLSDLYISRATGKSVSNVRSMFSFWISEGLISSTFVKGQVIDNRVGARAFESLQVEQPSRYSQTFLYKGRVIQFNKRSIDYGTSLVIGKPNSI